MEKYKICPMCGVHNSPDVWECIECEADLTAVRAVDKEIEKMEQERTDEPAPEPSEKLVRICDCGAHNLPSARKCSECGEDISDIIPVPEIEEQQRFILSSTDGEYAYEVTDSPVTIGREQVMQEYLSSKIFVSRIHAELKIEGEKLFITNISNVNGTYVNNEKLDDQPHELHDGDEVSLGGRTVNGSTQENAAYFIVRIGSCI